MNAHLLETLKHNFDIEMDESSLLNLLIAIIDLSPSIIFVKDDEGRYLIVNQEFEKYFCLRQSDIVGKTDFDIMSKDDAQDCVDSDQPAKSFIGDIHSAIELKETESGDIQSYLSVNKRVITTALGNLLIGIVAEIKI